MSRFWKSCRFGARPAAAPGRSQPCTSEDQCDSASCGRRKAAISGAPFPHRDQRTFQVAAIHLQTDRGTRLFQRFITHSALSRPGEIERRLTHDFPPDSGVPRSAGQGGHLPRCLRVHSCQSIYAPPFASAGRPLTWPTVGGGFSAVFRRSAQRRTGRPAALTSCPLLPARLCGASRVPLQRTD